MTEIDLHTLATRCLSTTYVSGDWENHAYALADGYLALKERVEKAEAALADRVLCLASAQAELAELRAANIELTTRINAHWIERQALKEEIAGLKKELEPLRLYVTAMAKPDPEDG